VVNLTYVKTHVGFVYLALVLDVFSRFIVGWQVSTSLRSDVALDALEMAIHSRRSNRSRDGQVLPFSIMIYTSQRKGKAARDRWGRVGTGCMGSPSTKIEYIGIVLKSTVRSLVSGCRGCFNRYRMW
jgi:transposase InsO family protein